MTPDYWTEYARAQLAREAAYGFMGWLLVWAAIVGVGYVMARTWKC